MATAQNGRNQGRGAAPSRQSPSPLRKGRGSAGDPTEQPGQYPSEIFGQTVPQSTGAAGSARGSVPADVTVQKSQLQDDLGGTPDHDVTSTGMQGSAGASVHGGGESVTYTDPWGVIGGVNRDVTVQGNVNGAGDWTLHGDDNGFSGPTLPGLESNRPTATGVGRGRIRGAGKGL